MLAFALDCEIGIDVERIRPIPEMMNMAKTILSPAETAEWISLPAERREETFFRVWTRKEACVKAVGEGLSARLEDFRVPLLQTSPIVIDIRDNLNRTQIWTLHDLNLPSNYTGSVIYRDNLRPILFFNDLPIDA